jgi:voltage-gated potassium channel
VTSLLTLGAPMSLSGPCAATAGSRSWTHDVLVSLPLRTATPTVELVRRSLLAVMFVAVIVALVWFDRDSYTDNHDGRVTLIDALYYATVSISTTGYGDITPIAQHARLLNALVVTPLRIGFLVLLVGTTLEVLANEGRRIIMDGRWRKRMRNHVVVVGFGTKGRSAVETLETSGVNPAQIVVIDGRPTAISDANLRGFAAIEGDATRRDILRRAEIVKAREVIITLDRDDSAILVMLTVRQLNPERPRGGCGPGGRQRLAAPPVRGERRRHLFRGGRPVARAVGGQPQPRGDHRGPALGQGGLEVGERGVTREEIGLSPHEISGDRVIAVVRNKTLRRFYDPTVARLEPGDQVVVVRQAATET